MIGGKRVPGVYLETHRRFPHDNTRLPHTWRDRTWGLCRAPAPHSASILVGTACSEEGSAPDPPIVQFEWQGRNAETPLPSVASSSGPIAVADIDGDGQLDLFVGGRVIPGRWPEAPASRIYRNHAGKWTLDGPNTKALENAGLVSSALFTDLDGDGWPELVLACEWGPIRMFRNQNGTLHEETGQWGLAQFTGWWNGVAVGDFDGDGKLDIVASNWGLNSPYHATEQHPVRIYYGDLSGRGSVDLFEATFDPELRDWAPMWIRDVLTSSLVWIAEKYPSHKAYSEASAESILGGSLAGRIASRLIISIKWFSSIAVTGLKRWSCRPKPSLRRPLLSRSPILTAMVLKMCSSARISSPRRRKCQGWTPGEDFSCAGMGLESCRRCRGKTPVY